MVLTSLSCMPLKTPKAHRGRSYRETPPCGVLEGFLLGLLRSTSVICIQSGNSRFCSRPRGKKSPKKIRANGSNARKTKKKTKKHKNTPKKQQKHQKTPKNHQFFFSRLRAKNKSQRKKKKEPFPMAPPGPSNRGNSRSVCIAMAVACGVSLLWWIVPLPWHGGTASVMNCELRRAKTYKLWSRRAVALWHGAMFNSA